MPLCSCLWLVRKLQVTLVHFPATAMDGCCGPQVALGLPLLPKVPISRTEAKRRASVKLLPLGMALLAAESFVQERLHSADICMNVLGS